MKILSIKLWIYLWGNVFLLLLSHYFGIFDILANVDFTYISFAIIAIMMIDISYLTIAIWKGERPDLEPHWFIKELLLAMGLTGTLIGLIYVFSPLAGVDLTNVVAMKELVVHVAAGVSTKLWTSLCGVVCGNILAIFLLLIESAYKQNPEVQETISFKSLPLNE